MRVWLINTSEPLPIDDSDVRLRRVGILAKLLAESGHEVLWWTSTFDHWHKRHRFAEDTDVAVGDNYHLRLLNGPGYRRNISLGRIRDHYVIGRKFKALSRTEPSPDVILCSLPTLDTSVEAVRFGKETGVPVVLDIRDLWPDVFVEMTPSWARPLMRPALRPMFKMSRTACADAFAISGNSAAFVQWGLCRGNRSRTEYDQDFPFGYVVRTPSDNQRTEAKKFWTNLGVGARSDLPVICFFGAIGYHFDLETVIQTARRIRHRREVQFVFCGVGDRLDFYREMANDCPNVVFPGWVNGSQIWTLMQMSSFALAPYVSNANFENNLTNKPIEYMSGGLPILTSLKRGTLHELIRENACGESYGNDPRSLEDKLCALCDAPQRRDEMSRRALELFTTRFTASKVYGQMAEYLRRVSLHAGPDCRQDPALGTARLPGHETDERVLT